MINTDIVYENIAAALLDSMQRENVENFTVKVFSTKGRDLQLTCEYVDGKSMADTLNEQAERIKGLESIAYSVASAGLCYGSYSTCVISTDIVEQAKHLLEDAE